MENEESMNEEKEMESLPAVLSETLPEIPEKVLDEIVEIADNVTLWVKPVATGFLLNEVLIEEIVGQIVHINPYLVQWRDNQPDKIPNVLNDLDIPEGYERRCDVELLTSSGARLGISLASSSFKFHFAPFVKWLKSEGLEPSQVLTRFRSKEVKGRHGTFVVVMPTLVNGPQKQVEEVVSPPPPSQVEGEDDIPF